MMLVLLLGMGGAGCITNNPASAVSHEFTSRKNLANIALAAHTYASRNEEFLPRNVVDKDGKPLLSWRVLLLPYLEQDALYKEFKLDEAWDSTHNLRLVERMPEVFASPRLAATQKGYATYQGFSGPDALFKGGEPGYKISFIPDGRHCTILAVESSNPVPWSKPEDIPFDMGKDVPDFGKAFDGKPLAALLDGSVRRLDLARIQPATLKLAINPNDGTVLGADWRE